MCLQSFVKVSAPNPSSYPADPAKKQSPDATAASREPSLRLVESTPGAAAQPGQSLSERQESAAAHLMSQVADLLANVQDGIRRNLKVDEPAKANQRLLKTAVGLIEDMVDANRVAGKRLFAPLQPSGSSPLQAYAQMASVTSQKPNDFVLAAGAMIREVEDTLQRVPVSTTDEVGRSFTTLSALENRVRSLRPNELFLGASTMLDRLL